MKDLKSRADTSQMKKFCLWIAASAPAGEFQPSIAYLLPVLASQPLQSCKPIPSKNRYRLRRLLCAPQHFLSPALPFTCPSELHLPSSSLGAEVRPRPHPPPSPASQHHLLALSPTQAPPPSKLHLLLTPSAPPPSFTSGLLALPLSPAS